jgi:hypothetical protein
MIIIILIILTKLCTWMVFGFPQPVWELDYWEEGVDSRQGQAHVSFRVALVPTQAVDPASSFLGNKMARTQS